MKKPARKTKPNKIIAGLQQALKVAASRVPVQPHFNPSQILCSGGRTIVADANGRPWLLDSDSGTATPVSAVVWQVSERK